MKNIRLVKLLSIVALLSFMMLSTACDGISESAMDKHFVPAKVERVVDGDTIKAVVNGKSSTVRLIGVDTPETVHPNKPVEFFGKEASEFTKKNLTGKTVYLQKDVSDTDRYGRYLSYVWLEQPSRIEPGKEEVKSKMFNAILISKGYGQVVTFPPDVKYTEWFRDFQQKPREEGLGMWGNPVDANKKPNSNNSSNSSDKNKNSSKNSTNSKSTIKKNTSNKSTSNKVNDTKKNNTNSTSSQKIKGNINSKGEKIYHVPGSSNYNTVKPEALFDTVEEAEAAGFRKPNR